MVTVGLQHFQAKCCSSFIKMCSSRLTCSTQHMPWDRGTASCLLPRPKCTSQQTRGRQLCDTVPNSMRTALVPNVAGASLTLIGQTRV